MKLSAALLSDVWTGAMGGLPASGGRNPALDGDGATKLGQGAKLQDRPRPGGFPKIE